jgi:HAD superfamily hydrolase (TIGR01509 family)
MPRTIDAPAGILLDLDNTVYDYAACHVAGLDAAQQAAAGLLARWRQAEAFRSDFARARHLAKTHTRGTAAEHNRLHYFKLMLERAAGVSGRLSAALHLHEAYWRGYFTQLRPDPGCAGLLADWRAAGIRLAWVSDFSLEQQARKLCALGLEEAAEVLVTSEEAGVEKPHPRPIQLALSRIGVPPDCAWLVGDSLERDVAGAHACGLAAVWFRRGQGAAAAGQPVPDAAVSSWAELRALWEAVRV